MSILLIFKLQQQLSHLTAAKFKPLMFPLCTFSLPYAASMVILVILYDSCLLPAQFSYVIVYIRKAGSPV
jgi:hypothetical protein